MPNVYCQRLNRRGAIAFGLWPLANANVSMGQWLMPCGCAQCLMANTNISNATELCPMPPVASEASTDNAPLALGPWPFVLWLRAMPIAFCPKGCAQSQLPNAPKVQLRTAYNYGQCVTQPCPSVVLNAVKPPAPIATTPSHSVFSSSKTPDSVPMRYRRGTDTPIAQPWSHPSGYPQMCPYAHMPICLCIYYSIYTLRESKGRR